MEGRINKIKDIMMSVATGQARIQDVNPDYQSLYNSLNDDYVTVGKENPNPFSDLWEFHHYWKENLPQYADRRNYIAKMYKTVHKSDNSNFWKYIHPTIIKISKSRFDSLHYADSVEAAFKEVNTRVKLILRDKTGEEDDGSSLMKRVFSLRNPVIRLDNIEIESGRNVQLGYMELFSGSMIGIRNPKAHENIEITREKAIHFIFLASLLMYKIDESIIN